ncbi:MAG: glycoside hydrolase 43 family protein [Telluria sp.]
MFPTLLPRTFPRYASALLALLAAALPGLPAQAQHETRPAAGLFSKTWTADNGNGSFTNPIFYDEFSDPDLIRVGDWFYMTGTTMHAMPGLPVLRSRDLVNWEFLGYALDKLDYGPQYRLEEGKNIYGRGIWAPALRYHKGVFIIFSNVNTRRTQVFTATDPRGPWTHREMKRGLHDLSVLFDDDGKVYAVWGHQDLRVAQLTQDLTDLVPGTEKLLFTKTDGMGEGAHFYKIDGKYFIISANYAGGWRMPAARANHVYGPYEVNRSISSDEAFGMGKGHSLKSPAPPFVIDPPDPAVPPPPLHQGGIVQTPAGEWWGFSMMDFNAVGRLLGLSPVTWKDGWPYFGLPGNLGRTPRTWVKPRTAAPQPVAVPFERSDEFAGTTLRPVWQWNHVPVDGKWSLTERPGFLRLHALPAASFWDARNSLTQRAIGPLSSPTVVLDASGLANGDVAGLGLLNLPYATLGVEKSEAGLAIVAYDQTRNTTTRVPLDRSRVWLRADCDFLTEKAHFSYSLNGTDFVPVGGAFTMVFQLKTFQGVRYALFNYSLPGGTGGHADFDSVEIYQPFPHGLMRPIPYGKKVHLASTVSDTRLGAGAGRPRAGKAVAWSVRDMGQGRVALQAGPRFLSVQQDGSTALRSTRPGPAQSFQWMETPTGQLALMSLSTNRFLRIAPRTLSVSADSPGPLPDGRDGASFTWTLVNGGLSP